MRPVPTAATASGNATWSGTLNSDSTAVTAWMESLVTWNRQHQFIFEHSRAKSFLARKVPVLWCVPKMITGRFAPAPFSSATWWLVSLPT